MALRMSFRPPTARNAPSIRRDCSFVTLAPAACNVAAILFSKKLSPLTFRTKVAPVRAYA